MRPNFYIYATACIAAIVAFCYLGQSQSRYETQPSRPTPKISKKLEALSLDKDLVLQFRKFRKAFSRSNSTTSLDQIKKLLQDELLRDPQATFKALATIPSNSPLYELLADTLGEFGASQPATLALLAKNLAEFKEQEWLRLSFRGLIDSDRAHALSLLANISEVALYHLPDEYLSQIGKVSPESLFNEMWPVLESANSKNQNLIEFFCNPFQNYISKLDTVEAKEDFFLKFSKDQRFASLDPACEQVAAMKASYDPKGAFDWASTLPSDFQKATMLEIFKKWGGQDYTLAKSFAFSPASQDAAREGMVLGLINSLSDKIPSQSAEKNALKNWFSNQK